MRNKIIYLKIDKNVIKKFPDLNVLLKIIQGVRVEEINAELEKFKLEVYEGIRTKYLLGSLKDISPFRLYRNFFWSIGIDSTKNRPAAEALIRRILTGKSIPKINIFVDSYNLASIQTGIAIAAFDLDQLEKNLVMKFAKTGDQFLGIDMKIPMVLKGGEVVIEEGNRLVAVYPYRDADYSKITFHTKNIAFIMCGVPGLESKYLKEASEIAVNYILKFCGSSIQIIH